MTDLRQAAQQALETLELILDFSKGGSYQKYSRHKHPRWVKTENAITALNTALAQPEQEPTPWRDMVVVSLVREGIDKHRARELADHFAAQPEPPPEWEWINNILHEYGLQAIDFVADWRAAQRPWQGLEVEDLAQIESDEFWQVGNHMAIAMAVEDKLKERNT